MTHLKIRARSAIAAALLLGGGLFVMPLHQAAAQDTQKASMMDERSKQMGVRSEERIRHLHDRLKITAEQEGKWAPVAKIMGENAGSFRTHVMARTSDKTSESAVEHLKTFQIISDQHADGLRKLIPAFEVLYDTLTPAQKKTADAYFGHHRRGGKRERSINM